MFLAGFGWLLFELAQQNNKGSTQGPGNEVTSLKTYMAWLCIHKHHPCTITTCMSWNDNEA